MLHIVTEKRSGTSIVIIQLFYNLLAAVHVASDVIVTYYL